MNQTDGNTTRIHDWVKQNFPLAQERNLGLDDSLLESGIIDSLGTLEVVQFLESEFNIILTDEEMLAGHFETINSIANLVASKREASRREAEAN